jgi:hypothetical protein
MQDSIGRVDTEVAKKYNFALASMLYKLNAIVMPVLMADFKEPMSLLLTNLLVYPDIALSPTIVKAVKNTSNDTAKPRISDQLLFYCFSYFVESVRLEQPIFLCSTLLRVFQLLGSGKKQLTVTEATSVWYHLND